MLIWIWLDSGCQRSRGHGSNCQPDVTINAAVSIISYILVMTLTFDWVVSNMQRVLEPPSQDTFLRVLDFILEVFTKYIIFLCKHTKTRGCRQPLLGPNRALPHSETEKMLAGNTRNNDETKYLDISKQ